MTGICDADLAFLKPGKKVLLKSFQGVVSAPNHVIPSANYWLLVGRKGCVVNADIDSGRALIRFVDNIKNWGLESDDNSLWVAIADLKFVCRY